MAFAIELYFQEAADSQIRKAWSELSKAGLPAWPLRITARPHVSILIVDAAPSVDIDAVFHNLIPASPFSLRFAEVDHFEGDDAIIFLKPAASEQLFQLHHRAVEEAGLRNLMPRHHGEEWVPHCTCDYGVSTKLLPIGLSILKRYVPFNAPIEEMGYVEVTSSSVRQIAVAELGHG
jgi:2'-5' RNA ligase